MPDSQQLAARITEMRDISTELIQAVNKARGEFKRWESGAYDPNGNGLTDAQVSDASFPTKTASNVRAMVNALAGMVSHFDSNYLSSLEEMSN